MNKNIGILRVIVVVKANEENEVGSKTEKMSDIIKIWFEPRLDFKGLSINLKSLVGE